MATSPFFSTDLDSQWLNSWRSEIWAGVRVCRHEVPLCVWGECDFHVNWLHVSRIRPTHWRLNDDFDINRRCRRLTRNIRMHVCVVSRRRALNRKKAAQLLLEGKRSEARDCLAQCIDITPQMALELINVSRLFSQIVLIFPHHSRDSWHV